MENSDYQLNNSNGDNYLLYNIKNNLSFFKKYKIYILIFGFLLLICIIICVCIYLSKDNILEICEEGDEDQFITRITIQTFIFYTSKTFFEGKCILNYSY